MMSKTTVVIADDHAILRDGLRTLFQAHADLEVVGEAADSNSVVQVVRESRPQVLCLDLSMPGGTGVRTIERVRAESPSTRILILTMHNDPAYLRVSLAAGAKGFMLKSTPVNELIDAIRKVASGERVIDPALPERGTNLLPAISANDPLATLSRREREVLDLLAQGHTHQEIAEKLFVSVKTVETYRARLREKTGLKTRADYVRFGRDTPPNQDIPEEN
ncbi:response regulator transcription factor [Tuwongella immobilis]|uniref:Uncharacterized protein n=1 Tax=Tuwongella immobilis TaxID=692036 RepID=A0A6C2YPJ3_9BACT|nr:response regulator transcription factor [Tuwongella immobilis]VIP03540.1 family transcriptional regulator : Two component transcriptional regulator, LuxR family OS=Chloroflexus aurantiacus (strain ATCC 29364 / DSM 637 / Y-400-fl) GN=Chy400_0025 PE=4 SV=1: Response_reg: GerE [Tuwongella immobilis]VTS04448.1 family transcriptional regulator : Two component transcriptional regulator, LuxR family OS=Chloroflexus aurantiacus (strain ATCC 29364 / DSM 637 / Y-400-fl) GN=Chy400_0025 PE=4 SV=1: Respons